MNNTCDDFIKCIIQQIAKDFSLNLEKEKEKGPITLSKMKKSDLVNECKLLGLPTTGSVLELKKSIKEHRVTTGTKTSRSKKVKKCIPVHTHPISTGIEKGCPLCQSHGNMMCMNEIEYEIV